MISFSVAVLAIISGVQSSFLFVFGAFLGKDKKLNYYALLWATMFLAASFSALEYAFWISGVDLFKLTFSSVPLLSYFATWLAFIIWAFEKQGKRKTWIVLYILLVTVIIIASLCMNCLSW